MYAAVCVLGLVAFLLSIGSGPSSPPRPPLPTTAFRARIVTAAESQLGYATDPADSYCNKFSAYWGVGIPCGSGLSSEEWCADFAAWAWQRAGALFTYSFAPGDINGSSWSFYEWATDHGTWHPAGAGYTAKPGDVAIYGLDTATASAQHVAIVTSDTPGARGPDVVNGDGDHTGFSVVEAGTKQRDADIHGGGAPLAGYVSPIRPGKSTS
ncbi:MAG: CHAP domain-containing protein [Solirubrobacteraceae bacterium]